MQPEHPKTMCTAPDGPSLFAPPGVAPPAGSLHHQSLVMRAVGTPFVADLLLAVERQLDKAPRSAAVIRAWGGDAASSAVAMRINAALHALARRGDVPLLSGLYAGEHRCFDEAVALALAGHDDVLLEWLHRVPQTNEIGRAAALHAGLMVLARDHGHAFELLEIGASAGLNLNIARYAYDLGGVPAGMTGSAVRIAPRWRGPPPPDAPVTVRAARGVDLDPLDVNDPAACERLASFIFADQPDRQRRLDGALTIARQHPPRVDKGDAASWLAVRLAEPMTDGRHRVVLHSMVMQYLGTQDREAIEAMLAQAGRAATDRRPLACIGFEWDRGRTRVELRLRTWPGGEDRVIAHCHPYGAWIEWQGA
ncbi:DUF2332 domain-containing protein [Sphingomonas sp. NPDC019816]|uniref:DUF2332 domain-containing protein n=1 Tax=Sphingomonas sp. NPDC019816 TaxID=3390679 RepID=UPI003D03D303